MKKNYYMVLIALFTLALNAFSQEGQWETVAAPSGTEAQSEDYNMVITLPDGTTVTVSTDDVDDIQFSNGQISVSGTSIQQLMSELMTLQTAENDTRDRVAMLQAICDDLKNSVITNQMDAANLKELLAELQAREAAHKEITNRLQDDIEDQKNRVNAVVSVIEKVETQQATLADQITAQQADVTNLYGQVNNTLDKIARHDTDIIDLVQYTNEQQVQIHQLKAIIAMLENEVAELKNEVAELKNK